jgi:TldD protein
MGREAAQAGESYLSVSSLGMEVGSQVVNVVDDPTMPRSFGFYLYDEECVKARKRYLIKEGRINEFLQNRETAAATGTSSNAAARATSYDREPIVRMANTYMEPGDHSFEELISDIRRGVFVKNFTEWNIDDRRFNQKYVGHEAYMIEDGELGLPVRNPAIEMTTVGFFKAIDAVGNDLLYWAATCGKGDPMQGAPVWACGPTVRLRGIKLGGASA